MGVNESQHDKPSSTRAGLCALDVRHQQRKASPAFAPILGVDRFRSLSMAACQSASEKTTHLPSRLMTLADCAMEVTPDLSLQRERNNGLWERLDHRIEPPMQ